MPFVYDFFRVHSLKNSPSDELNAEVNNMVRMLGKTNGHKMKKQWEQNGVLARLQSRIKRDKTLDAVMKEVKAKEEVVDRKEDIDNN